MTGVAGMSEMSIPKAVTGPTSSTALADHAPFQRPWPARYWYDRSIVSWWVGAQPVGGFRLTVLMWRSLMRIGAGR